jgi:hypothetical protein
MSLSVLVVHLLSGVAAEGSADMVSITASGALQHGPLEPKRSSRTVRRHGQRPDDDLPFVLDGPATQNTFKPLPATAAAATAFDDSPFMLDDGIAPKAPPPGSLKRQNDSPFVIDSPLVPQAAMPNPAAEVQKEAAAVNDSPFVLDTQPSQAPSSGTKVNHDPTMNGASPFVEDQLVQEKTEVNEDDDRDDEAHMAQISKQVEKKGNQPFTIVRNGHPQPHTTEMVRNAHFGETTTDSPSSTRMEFELEGSFLETGTEKRFVSVPGTPFELDMQVISSRQRQPKILIPLDRQVPGQASQIPILGFNALSPNSAPMPVVYPIGGVPVLNPTNAFMQNAVLTNQMAPIAMQMATGNTPASSIVPVSPPEENNAGVASAPQPIGQTATKSKTQVADADVPLSTKATLNAPVVLPAPQIGPDSPTGNSTVKKEKKGTGQASVKNVSSSIGDAAASLGLNGTNSTLKGHVPAKAVTIRGAIIAIFLGLVVTVFFLSLVLCMLNAGRKPPDESEAREPPRPTRSYRQLLKAQIPEGSQSAASSGPSV